MGRFVGTAEVSNCLYKLDLYGRLRNRLGAEWPAVVVHDLVSGGLLCAMAS